ncbi:putative phage abortive infection protein [Flammeovirga yaeyamensis]|uniref:Phage abortive infection protein n=1 Tax=Flammeovirga yaeyamensis TaxID=367791 RepID=A0AAX1NET0_9BACT|nr:putative phage abortive infection protein [Flammeovirga yaeyamensis]MBB3696870.1 hypothetical protein [Flammeovirga yaeyamensis]NMF33535.1 hypothetical protein [Flammeovirga yaeyamensis]QWG05195.1 putative phage abortive infection protein [Flammeovirga yaeyamensis]
MLKLLKKINISLTLSVFLAITGISVMLVFFLDYHLYESFLGVDMEVLSKYGSFIAGTIGPIFSLVGFILIYETIKWQRKLFERQQFEVKFFEMMKYHRENVELLRHKDPASEELITKKGREVFIALYQQCNQLQKEVMQLLPKGVEQSEKEYHELTLNITYLIFHFGLQEHGEEALVSILNKYVPHQAEHLITELKKKRSKYNAEVPFYVGHQSKLGNYFRHLYHTIKYVDQTKFLTEDEKQSFIKMLRAQFTTYEQAIIFYNAMSVLGKKWRENRWIEKYELIKNIPPKFLGEIDPKEFFEMRFEYEGL